MKLSELMANHTPKEDFSGIVTQDDMVLAVDVSSEESAGVGDYAVVQLGIEGVDSAMNPQTADSTYLRSGTSTTKTGTQRSFKVTGDRYIGDAFQDFALSPEIKFGTGADVVRDYVYFNVRTGKGEKGKVTIIVNNDASGNAGENASIDIELKVFGEKPVEYKYSSGTGNGENA